MEGTVQRTPLNFAMETVMNMPLDYPLDDSQLLRAARAVLNEMPALQEHLGALHLCPPSCNRHSRGVVRVIPGAPAVHHITVGFCDLTATREIAHCTAMEGFGKHPVPLPGRLQVRLGHPCKMASREELRSLLAHELIHAGDFARGCEHADAHCACFFMLGSFLNHEYSAGVRVYQSCKPMGM